MKQVLVTLPLTGAQRERLEELLPGGSFTYSPAAEVTDGQVAEAEILVGNLPPARLAAARKLAWVQLGSSGADAYTKPGVLAPGVQLTNATGAYGLALSEHLLAQTFYLKKKLGLYARNQRAALWRDEGRVTAIQGSVTMVVGLGSIGGDYARKMAALGSTVYGIRRHVGACPSWLKGLGTLADLDAWLPRADIVALSLPGAPDTQGLFHAGRFARMKPGSILLNVGRGSAIVTDDLVAALRQGPLAAAALDVTDPEPLPAEHPLWQCENLLLTPHVAGDFHLQETQDAVGNLVLENVARYAAGRPLLNPVDRESGYRQFER